MKKINVKEKLTDDTLDLSMCELVSVPVKDIVEIQKAKILNLSFNNLIFLPEDFIKLQQIRELDLSNNHLKALPKTFGQLQNLKRLDLYKNDLECLPLSFYELKHLQWLDLKDNPLNPQLKHAAGDCLEDSQCKKCAVDVLKYMRTLAANEERKHQELLKKRREEEARKKQLEEEERKKLKEIKKLEKEERKRLLQEKHQNETHSDAEYQTKSTENDDDDDNTSNDRKHKQNNFIPLIVNLLLTISLFIFILFIIFNIYCEKFLDKQHPLMEQLRLGEICAKYNQNEKIENFINYLNNLFSK